MSDWVKCPVCGEDDMQQDDEGIIHCTNLMCGSNGGRDYSAAWGNIQKQFSPNQELRR